MTDSGPFLASSITLPVFGRPGLLNQTITPSLDRYRQMSSRPRPIALLRGADQGPDWSSYRERYWPTSDIVPAFFDREFEWTAVVR
jgi:hypothetical protein